MDLNLAVIAGRLAAEPEVTRFASGATLLRILVTVRSQEPRRRIDVIPVVQWDPTDETIDSLERGCRVWVASSIQQRFWSAETGRTSRVELVASDIVRQADETTSAMADTDMETA